MKWLRRRKQELPVHRVEDETDLVEALGSARGVLYKHSPSCWASAMAIRHISGFIKTHPDIPVYMIDVIANRSLSMEAAHRLQIHHESPQAIAIVDGEVVWSGSHWEVTTDALTTAIGAT